MIIHKTLFNQSSKLADLNNENIKNVSSKDPTRLEKATVFGLDCKFSMYETFLH